MFYGKPTGAAMPLMWAHAEYLKLLRSTADGVVFDLIPEVAERYRERKSHPPIEVWKQNRKIPFVTAPCKLPSGNPVRQKAAVDFVISGIEKGTLKPIIDRVFASTRLSMRTVISKRADRSARSSPQFDLARTSWSRDVLSQPVQAP
jgi:hypothetical protein